MARDGCDRSDSIRQVEPHAESHRGAVGKAGAINSRRVGNVARLEKVDHRRDEAEVVHMFNANRAAAGAVVPQPRIRQKSRWQQGMRRSAVGEHRDKAFAIRLRVPSRLGNRALAAAARTVEHEDHWHFRFAIESCRHMHDEGARRLVGARAEHERLVMIPRRRQRLIRWRASRRGNHGSREYRRCDNR